MKGKIILLAALSLGSLLLKDSMIDLSSNTSFDNWMKIHNKVYPTEAEKIYREKIWMTNLAYVEAHNALHAKGLVSFDLGMNAFADLENREFAAIYTNPMLADKVEKTDKCTGPQAPSTSVPATADWSDKGAVTGIKNQGQCGSCWAFSATGSMEGAKYLKDKTILSFSEQQLVDCSHAYGNNGCNGGLMDDAFYYVIDNGIALESVYPYKGIGGTCHYDPNTQKAWTISNCVDVTVDKELSLLASITQQPVSVAIEANHMSFQLYKSGVYSGNCGTKLDHGVLAVGFGTLSDKKFFKVKNSWGSSWGTQGYILIERTGDGKGKCGIQMAASFPLA